jgi:hypothetical protein
LSLLLKFDPLYWNSDKPNFFFELFDEFFP